MGNLDINNAVVGTSSDSSYVNQLENTDFYNGSYVDTDGVEHPATFWTTDWARWHGFYNDIPIFAAVIDTLACWSVGKGYKGKDVDKVKNIKGWGKDDFNSIIENLARVFLCGGDAQAEIVKDKAGRLTNLKPLNPGKIKSVINEYGILNHYEQTLGGEVKRFEVKEIFHLSWDRLADEVHGKPYAQRSASIITQIKQLTEDLGLRFHRIVKPIRLFEADTDDDGTLTSTETKLKTGYEKCEIIVIPKGTLEAKDVAAIPNADDAINYLNYLMRLFVSSCNVPEVILGWGEKSTEATSKIIYLAFQQRIERIQKFIEEQLRLQLGIELEFEFPASLEEQMTTPGVTGKLGTETPKVSNPSSDLKKEKKLNNVGGN
jgi:hypothetical protein